jgi:membrane protease YdiL (CAAX protease family)
VNQAPPAAPGPLGALLLSTLACCVLLLVAALATPAAGGTFGIALGLALGFGGAGTLAARALPPPAHLRIGLCGFAPRLLVPLLLLAPGVLLASELDNWIATLFPGAKDAQPDAGLGALDALEWALFAVLLRPVLEEFFFRGVVQQGVVAALGPGRGVVFTAALYALVRAALHVGDAYRTLSFGTQALAEGLLLGALRLASGSILPGVLLQAALAALGLAALAAKEWLPIPGFNAAGAHTPAAWLAPAVASVALGLALLARESRRPD